MTFDADDRLGAIAVPTLVLHGTADNVVDSRNAELLAERSRARASSSSRARPPVLLGGARAFVRVDRGVPGVSEHTIGRWLRDRARLTPARVAIDHADGR